MIHNLGLACLLSVIAISEDNKEEIRFVTSNLAEMLKSVDKSEKESNVKYNISVRILNPRNYKFQRIDKCKLLEVLSTYQGYAPEDINFLKEHKFFKEEEI
jgi:hypothetical protein